MNLENRVAELLSSQRDKGEMAMEDNSSVASSLKVASDQNSKDTSVTPHNFDQNLLPPCI
ncbi:hypothetical protein [Vibrio penaeicida]|uniref:hypothetical protein n=1 Tax=Vibrio penaeicida TaxID=104609 RepID=UPI001CC664A1|nr:hypothetical protein [Vibrio penaeicida]